MTNPAEPVEGKAAATTTALARDTIADALLGPKRWSSPDMIAIASGGGAKDPGDPLLSRLFFGTWTGLLSPGEQSAIALQQREGRAESPGQEQRPEGPVSRPVEAAGQK